MTLNIHDNLFVIVSSRLRANRSSAFQKYPPLFRVSPGIEPSIRLDHLRVPIELRFFSSLTAKCLIQYICVRIVIYLRILLNLLNGKSNATRERDYAVCFPYGR